MPPGSSPRCRTACGAAPPSIRGRFTAHAFADRLAAAGDVFAAGVTRIGLQELPLGRVAATPRSRRTRRAATSSPLRSRPRRCCARDADAVVAEALARKLVPPQTTRDYVYTVLIEYIVTQPDAAEAAFAALGADVAALAGPISRTGFHHRMKSAAT